MKITGIELTHEVLVNILSDATYGNCHIEIKTLKSESHLDGDAEFECIEDKWANRLLKGGHLVVVDYEDEDDNDQPVRHRITLEDIKKGCCTKDGMYRVSQLLSKNDDMWTGYGLIQCAIFGEEVYG